MKRIIGLILVLLIIITSFSSCIPLLFVDPTPGFFTYNDFTNRQKNIFKTYIGEVIPFAPTDKYYVTEIFEGEGYESGVRYYTIGNSEMDYAEYINRLVEIGYKFDGTEENNEGTKWSKYSKGNVALTTAYYEHNGQYFLDVCVTYLYKQPDESGIISNKGLKPPKDEDGVIDVDFTKSKYIKDFGDFEEDQLSCPSVGSPAVLVIPVEFPDLKAADKGYTIENIERIMCGERGETDYYSVDEYYYLSSYGRLDLDITVLDSWYTAENRSSYYKTQTQKYNDEIIDIGDQVLINEVLDYLDDKMDLSKFDSDGNGTIDSIVMVNTLNISESNLFTWAYQFRNIYSDENDSYYQYDGVYAYDYVWLSYGFMHEKTSYLGNSYYNDKSVMNPKVFIHEFAHIIGAMDYYDTSYESLTTPLLGNDIMDSELGDHNPFTKIGLGWIDKSRFVSTDTSVTLTLKPFSESGDTIIIGNNFSEELGAFQEYYILMYYRPTGLNNSNDKYFSTEGIVLYHVNATLYYEKFLDESFYSLANSNTKGESADNLIELVRCNGQSYIMDEKGSLRILFDDSNEILHIGYTVESLNQKEAVITFSRR